MVKMLCECGCGLEVKEGRRFIKGYHRRGVKLSEETKQKMCEAHKGKKLSDDHKRKISEAMKGKYLGENNPMFGKCHLEETKKKMREYKKQYYEEHPEAKQKISEVHKGKKLSEETKKKISEARKGENNPNWRGGISFEPYRPKFNESLKEKIRKQFDYKCFLCGKTQEEQINEMKNQGKQPHRLSIHHVDFDKEQGCNGREWRLVPLCLSCHAWTNYNREESKELIIKMLEVNQ